MQSYNTKMFSVTRVLSAVLVCLFDSHRVVGVVNQVGALTECFCYLFHLPEYLLGLPCFRRVLVVLSYAEFVTTLYQTIFIEIMTMLLTVWEFNGKHNRDSRVRGTQYCQWVNGCIMFSEQLI